MKERKEIVQRFAHYERKEPKDVELPEQPACVSEELGTPLDGFRCKTCEFLTININAIRIHLKKKAPASLGWREKCALSFCQSSDVFQKWWAAEIFFS